MNLEGIAPSMPHISGLGRSLAVQRASVHGHAAFCFYGKEALHEPPGFEALGFLRCAAYDETPLPNTIFMELWL